MDIQRTDADGTDDGTDGQMTTTTATGRTRQCRTDVDRTDDGTDGRTKDDDGNETDTTRRTRRDGHDGMDGRYIDINR